MRRFFIRPVFLPALAVLLLFFSRELDAQTSFDWVFPGDKIEETEGRGLVVRSYPSVAVVYIDGIERGSTPLRLDLRPGRYVVQVKKEGYEERSFRVNIRPGSAIDVSLELKEAVGRVLLKIKPAPGSPAPDASPPEFAISVDGVPYPARGSALELALVLTEGYRTIRIRSFGLKDISTTLYVERDSYREIELVPEPALFGISGALLSRLSFNPADSGSLGTTAINFEVSGPGTGVFSVLDKNGKTVFSRNLGPFETWVQSAEWDGRDNRGEILEDGHYTLVIDAVSGDNSLPAELSLALGVELDSSRRIYPLTMSSGKSGLLYAPLPALLPPRSFQVEGSILAGMPPASDAAWKSLPFAAAFRFSPLQRLEVSAALNAIPRFDEKSGAGFGAGAKWAYMKDGDIAMPLTAAAGLNFSWTGKTGLTPFGMASGFEIFFPFKLDVGRIFSFALSPAALWTGDDGFPWEPAPRLLLSGALLAQMKYVSAGLSIRSEFNFYGGNPPPRIISGAEIKIFPPPSSFIVSFLGGIWKQENNFGGFGGLGIGIIH